MIETGIKGNKEQIVTPEMSAARVGSGLVDVFATPMLVALVEQTCYESVLPHLDEGQGTVGTLVNVSHLSATPIGKRVWCDSELTEVSTSGLPPLPSVSNTAWGLNEHSVNRQNISFRL